MLFLVVFRAVFTSRAPGYANAGDPLHHLAQSICCGPRECALGIAAQALKGPQKNRAMNCTGIFAVGNYSIVFFDRCVLDLSRRAAAPAGGGVGQTRTAIRFGDNNAVTSTGFRACEIILDLPGESRRIAFWLSVISPTGVEK